MMSVAAKLAEELNIRVMNDLSHLNRYAKFNVQWGFSRGSGILPILQIS